MHFSGEMAYVVVWSHAVRHAAHDKPKEFDLAATRQASAWRIWIFLCIARADTQARMRVSKLAAARQTLGHCLRTRARIGRASSRRTKQAPTTKPQATRVRWKEQAKGQLT